MQNLNSDEKLVFPTYDDKKETISDFLRRVKQFEITTNTIKYNKILEFINALMKHIHSITKLECKPLTALIEFSNISATKLMIDTKFNKKLMDTYNTEMSKILNVNALELTKIISVDDIIDNDIIIYLKKILEKINYYIKIKQSNNEIYYSIKANHDI